jgi:phage shock protein E
MRRLAQMGVFILSCTVPLFACQRGSIDPDDVRRQVANGAVVIDVRTPAEFRAGSYPEALNVPLGELERRLDELPSKETPLVLYCRSGNRSGKAKTMLERQGYMHVTNGGGLKDMPK